MTTRLRAAAVAALATAALLLTSLPTAEAAPAAQPAPTAAKSAARTWMLSTAVYEAEMLQHLNEARSKARKCGSTKVKATKPAKLTKKLVAAARKHTNDMAKRNYFAHNTKGKKKYGPRQRIKAAGLNPKRVAETLAAGHRSPQETIEALLKSPAHCKILMSSSYTRVGIATSISDHSKYGRYIALDFATSK